jgi:hypothetical protein
LQSVYRQSQHCVSRARSPRSQDHGFRQKLPVDVDRDIPNHFHPEAFPQPAQLHPRSCDIR